ncbi:serine hydrolase BPHL-like [Branchiostoma floridae x Branchiostoma japonicum]
MSTVVFSRLASASNRLKLILRHVAMASTSAESIPHQKVEVNGVNINYAKVGTGDHPVLLMPGALGSTLTDFTPQLEKLDRQKLTVVGWDPRGYGKSRPPDKQFDINFFHQDAADAAALMQKIGFDKFSLAGWSDGAITAIILAGTYPQLVRKMVIWGGNAFVTEEDCGMYEATRDISNWSERMRAPMINMYGEEYFRKTWERWIEGITQFLQQRNGDICKTEASQVTCPTFILHGVKDPMVPGVHPDYLQEHIKGSRRYDFPDGKHNIHLRYADEFNKLMEDFLMES